MGFNTAKGFRKKGVAKPVYDGFTFDSIDEVGTYMWLEECKDHGLIGSFSFHPPSIEITEPVKRSYTTTKKDRKGNSKEVVKEETFLRGSSYTTDFIVFDVHPKLEDIIVCRNGEGWIDTKGKWSAKGGGKDGKYFSLLKKVVYKLHGIYINTFVCEDVFSKTFVPEKYRLTEKTKQVKKAFKDCKTIKQFMEEN